MDRPKQTAPWRRWPWLNLGLFLATVATTLFAGADIVIEEVPLEPLAIVRAGWPYAAALIAILGAHEMGHFVLARRHRVDATWPYFLPFPFGVGTFGAVIRMRSVPPSRRAVLDIGVAGPLAGFAVALPLLFWGLAHSTLVANPAVASASADSPWHVLLAWWQGRPLASASSPVALMLGDGLLTSWAQRLVWGPLPVGKTLFRHPVAVAACLGMLVTTLNLVPIGQLDGGHLTYALLGRERAARLSRLVSWGLLGCGLLLSWNWLVWWLLTRAVVGVHHPPAWDEQPLDRRRAAVAVVGLVLFVLTFVPVPFAF